MSDECWYKLAEDTNLRQGEIILNCDVVKVNNEIQWPITESTNISVDIIKSNLIILSQSCDLENNKIEDILLAEVIAWPEIVKTELAKGNTSIKSTAFRQKLINGEVPGMSLLHKHINEPLLEWSIVDFHRLYTMPKKFIQEQLTHLGLRLRLLSPYREHLAQNFARYFMRVGLPHDAKAFIDDGRINQTK